MVRASHNNQGETDMNTKNNIRKIMAIVFSLFMGNGLLIALKAIFPTQIKAILPTNGNYRSFVVEVIGALITMGLIFLFKKTNVLKITGKGLGTGLFCGLPLLITYTLMILLSLLDLPGKTLLPTLEVVLVISRWFLIGLAEEGLFRGVVQELFMDIFGSKTRKSVIISIVCTAMVFGLSHFQNLFAGVKPSIVLVQAANAAALGLVFGAITFRSGRSVLPTVLIHAFIDGAGFLYHGMLWGASTVESINALSVGSLILIPIYTGIFIFLMRKSITDPLFRRTCQTVV
jgi:membrane protease YdiL (CAAX protease family)